MSTVLLISICRHLLKNDESSRLSYIGPNLPACSKLSWLQAETSVEADRSRVYSIQSLYRPPLPTIQTTELRGVSLRRHRREPKARPCCCLSLCRMPVRGEWWNKMLPSWVGGVSCITALGTQGYFLQRRHTMVSKQGEP